MTASLEQFTQELDVLLGLHPGPAPALDDAALQTAPLLMGMDLDANIAPQPELRVRWISHTRTLNSQRSNRSLFTTKWAWIVAILLVLALLIAFRQPVFAAVGRLFGYIYIQDSGFLPAELDPSAGAASRPVPRWAFPAGLARYRHSTRNHPYSRIQ